MPEVKTLVLAFEHNVGNEYPLQPDEKVVALWKADRKIKIIGSMLCIHISETLLEMASAIAEITLEPRTTMDLYKGGEKSEPSRVINFFHFYFNALTSGAYQTLGPNIVMFPAGHFITVEKDSTIHLIDKSHAADNTGSTWALVFYTE
ncbi:hypothetical protein ES705_42743 [subsurface metagenome]